MVERRLVIRLGEVLYVRADRRLGRVVLSDIGERLGVDCVLEVIRSRRVGWLLGAGFWWLVSQWFRGVSGIDCGGSGVWCGLYAWVEVLWAPVHVRVGYGVREWVLGSAAHRPRRG